MARRGGGERGGPTMGGGRVAGGAVVWCAAAVFKNDKQRTTNKERS